MNIVARKLAAKELYVNRWLIVGGVVSGIASAVVASLGRVGFNIGSLLWISGIIATGVILALYGIVNERKENSLHFVLSLPLSIADYVRAKMLGLLLSFLMVWLVSSVAALVLVFAKDAVPDGIAPYTVLLCAFMLANFCIVLCGMAHTQSDSLATAVVVVTNMGVTIFMFIVAPMHGISQHMWAPAPVWNSTFWMVLACELAIMAVAFTLPFFFAARRRDFL